jgi:hypothetical protein
MEATFGIWKVWKSELGTFVFETYEQTNKQEVNNKVDKNSDNVIFATLDLSITINNFALYLFMQMNCIIFIKYLV